MRIGRVISFSVAAGVGWLTWKTVKVVTRPLPCEPLQGVRVPPEPLDVV